MTPPILQLNLRPGALFKGKLVAFIQGLAEEELPGEDRWSFRSHAERRAAAQNALAGYIQSIPVEDSRLFLLAQVAQSQYSGSWRLGGEPFAPTVSQNRILYSLAENRFDITGPDVVFSELVSAGVADMAVIQRERLQEAERDKVDAEKRAAAAEAKVAPLAQAEEELAAERAKSEALQATIDRLQRRASDLEGFVTAEGGSTPRRVHVGGGPENVGIYRALSEGAFVFEVGYPDDEGKQRWRRLGPDASIDDARALRRNFAGRPHDPDHGGLTDDEIVAAESEGATDAGDQGDGDTKTTTTEPVAAGKEG